MTEDELQAAQDAIARARAEREQKCLAEINEVLRRNNCTLDIAPDHIGVMLLKIGIMVRAL